MAARWVTKGTHWGHSLTFQSKGRPCGPRGGARAPGPLLGHSLLEVLALLLLPLVLLQAALLLRLAEVVLQGEPPCRLEDLPLQGQVGLQRVQLWVLEVGRHSLNTSVTHC